jgi:plasmid stability protein
MEVNMAVMTIRNIDDAIKKRLRVRAAVNGRSMEDEARDILRSALSTDDPRPRNLGQAIHERFGPLGGVDLPDVPREAIRKPVDFG